ncbi:MAG: hypothetical protein PHQ43_13255 [Dehalococcoidales bacterium]|nr:hypothetical protein [Dehalococcoidales bacterium]
MVSPAKAKTNGKDKKDKVPAPRLEVGQIIITDAWERVFNTGSRGFFGRGMDAAGKRYQITAIEIGTKPKN